MTSSLRFDPSRTATLRRRFCADITRRMDRLTRKLRQYIEVEDVFGLAPRPMLSNVFCPTGPGGGVDPSCKAHSKYVAVLEELKSRFPKLRALPEVSVRVSESVSSTGMTGLADPKADLYGAYTHGKGEILLKSSIPDEGKLTLGADTVGYSKSIAIRHEYGHHVQDHHRTSIGVPIDPISGRRMSWQNIATEFVGTDKLPAVSSYGRLSHKELFAESFAAYTDVSYIRGSLPKTIETYMDAAIGNGLTANDRYRFQTDEQKLETFRQYLARELKDTILTDEATTADDWWQKYVEEGYRLGAGRVFDDTRKAVLYDGSMRPYYLGTKQQFLQSSFGRPVSVEKVKLLSSRVFTDLKGITDSIAMLLTRELADGLSQGKSPREVAREIAKTIETINKTRALTMARTETIRAHAEGQLDALEQLGVEEIGVAVEWSVTTHLDGTIEKRVCPLCRPMKGVVLKVKESHGLIPRHPNCRCSFIPANVGEDEQGQKRSKTSIQKAVDRSIAAEIPPESKKTVKQQKRDSSWQGADLEPDANRPESIL